ncbi:Hcp family T6SS protein CtsH3 [Citrobacter koseri]|uniref:Hcp family T6SS protein CtsH3 n=1 Tax=Citrobacter koseri TaxID=545 RepID=A0A2X2W7R6_CITKO|nr:Hcp family T6SS protein CtsH3 [Citrobacter koseri]
MSDIVYLTVSGQQQGAISAGCGTDSLSGATAGKPDTRMKFSYFHSRIA